MDQLRYCYFLWKNQGYGKTYNSDEETFNNYPYFILKKNQSSGWLDNSYRNYDIDYPQFKGENLYCDWLGKNGQQLWKDWH